MSKFTTRVVLHDANWLDYENLHGYMEAEGFSRYIRSDNGQTWQMPEAEYNYESVSVVAIADVYASAMRASARTGRNYAVFVTEAAARQWIGLVPIQRP